ncbi:hypothetical protein [Priestia koreensis]|uniref:hypothetical protein n=1 Tax=Priestia koreensis TaxID=284581 RepID=UPI0020401C3D|nr:hypothetical protein [Priestia koreensis]MCM3005687.1 hypothetical protein [Priestia koreensis]
MAKELYSQKVEGETKESLNRLTEKYKDQGLIIENGDLLNLAADLLERNLNVQAPRHVVGMEELDQLTSRINRLFTGMVEQNNSSMEALRTEMEEKYNKAKLTIDSLLIEKQELKDKLTERETKLQELTELTLENQKELDGLKAEKEKNDKYIARLERDSEQQENKIKQLEQFEKQNEELKLDKEQKDEEIQKLLGRITELEASAIQQDQAHQNEIRELKFQQKEALFNKEKELNEQYNKELSEIRNRQAEFLDKHEERMTTLQDKYNGVLAEKQQFEALYKALEESNKQKGNKPGGNK